MEASERYSALANTVFEWIEIPGNSALTSTITLTELLARPYQVADDTMVRTYHALLTAYPNLSWVPPDLAIADLAAQFRAKHRMRTPDSLQAATAIHATATGFVTNDPVFKRVEAFEALVLDDVIPKPQR